MPEDHIEAKIFAAIEAERKERRSDIAEIHNRIDQVLEAVRQLGGRPVQNNMSVLILFVTVTLSLSGMFAISLKEQAQTSKERNEYAREIARMRDAHLREVMDIRFEFLREKR